MKTVIRILAQVEVAVPTNDPTATNEIADAQHEIQDNGEWTAIQNILFLKINLEFSYNRHFSYFQYS